MVRGNIVKRYTKFAKEYRAIPTNHNLRCIPLTEPQPPETLNPSDCFLHKTWLQVRLTTWLLNKQIAGTTRTRFYRVIWQGVDPSPASHITVFWLSARLPGDYHLIWQVPARKHIFDQSPASINKEGTSAAQLLRRLESAWMQGGQARKALLGKELKKVSLCRC